MNSADKFASPSLRSRPSSPATWYMPANRWTRRSQRCARQIPSIAAAGENCAAVARGLVTFLDHRLHGLQANGRSCADCHMPSDSLQLSPADAEARFRLLQWRRTWNPLAKDPLFLPIDADDFRVNGEAASDFSNLRENGLIRVTMPLPANVRLIDPATNAASSETTVDVWRAVPSVFNVKLTGPDGAIPWPRGPNPTGGYQLDGRKADSAGAGARAHSRRTRRSQAPPPQRMLDDLAAFQNVLFSSPRVRVLADAVRDGSARCLMSIRHSLNSRRRARSCSRAPAPSAMAVPASRPSRRR